MRPLSGPGDRTVQLPDGRTLGYVELGDPRGVPVVNCHGGLSCRLDVEAADGPARQAGVRLLSPDRPGIGRSSRCPDRTIGSWARDVVDFADRSGVERFAVMGWSFGGPYAAACAALCPDRVLATALVAGGVPLDWPSASKGFENRTDALMYRLCRSAPWLASPLLWAGGEVAARAPRLWMRTASRAMAPSDLDAISRDGTDAFVRSIAEGLRRPGGVVDDYVAYGRPWGFAYEDIPGPVYVWQGEEDTFLPVTWSQEAARRIPNATLRMVPGKGHMVARDCWGEIFADLVGG
ncbi:MAG TPA: alpha/beta hydrolase [Acidimicrobiales bacterium]|nr:alpha/beta hydrolase [Acidimicrobiales bacterium]